jgi:hypothetical protein
MIFDNCCIFTCLALFRHRSVALLHNVLLKAHGLVRWSDGILKKIRHFDLGRKYALQCSFDEWGAGRAKNMVPERERLYLYHYRGMKRAFIVLIAFCGRDRLHAQICAVGSLRALLEKSPCAIPSHGRACCAPVLNCIGGGSCECGASAAGGTGGC